MLQAMLDANNIVVTVNDWENTVGIQCEPWVQVGMLWTGLTFVRHPNDVVRELQDGVQAHMNATVQTRYYYDILSCCSYATSTVPRFAAEGQAAVAWRDAVWDACYVMLDEFLAGNRPAPTLDELIAELPTINW
jgi:hypothetical protein